MPFVAARENRRSALTPGLRRGVSDRPFLNLACTFRYAPGFSIDSHEVALSLPAQLEMSRSAATREAVELHSVLAPPEAASSRFPPGGQRGQALHADALVFLLKPSKDGPPHVQIDGREDAPSVGRVAVEVAPALQKRV